MRGKAIEMQDKILGFLKDRKIFITGHTGFKGSWRSEERRVGKECM